MLPRGAAPPNPSPFGPSPPGSIESRDYPSSHPTQQSSQVYYRDDSESDMGDYSYERRMDSQLNLVDGQRQPPYAPYGNQPVFDPYAGQYYDTYSQRYWALSARLQRYL